MLLLLGHARRLWLHGKPSVLLLKRRLLPEAGRLRGERAGLLLSRALLPRTSSERAPILLLAWSLGITTQVGVGVRVHRAGSASVAGGAGEVRL